jgi:hypothetical protein
MMMSVQTKLLPMFERPSGAVRVVLLAVLLICTTQVAWAQEEESDQPEDWEERLEMLRSMPYIGFSEEESAESESDVVLYDPDRAWDGYNFFGTRTDGHAHLLDMHGNVVHTWTYPPKTGPGSDHALMLPNGELLAIKKFQELLRLDWDSNLIWNQRMRAHHDLAMDEHGAIYTLVQTQENYRGIRVRFDVIVHLTPEGEEIRRWSTYTRLGQLKEKLDTRSFLDVVLDKALGDGSGDLQRDQDLARQIASKQYNYDYFHINTVFLLPDTPLGRADDRFAAGNLLVCFRNVNQIAILDKTTGDILWSWGEGELEWPHYPNMLSNGNILIFDNGKFRKYSRAVEMNPVTGQVVWEYVADPPEDFFSEARGSAQRLPNGNTLITESDRGRVFEVTSEGQIVWVWLNPARQGANRETVYRMLRLPPEAVEPLLQEHGWWGAREIEDFRLKIVDL